jgi:hypothetical protein
MGRKKLGPPEGTTPQHIMKERYPQWDWRICPICEQDVHYRKWLFGMHPWCSETKAGKSLISTEKNKSDLNNVSLFGDDGIPDGLNS